MPTTKRKKTKTKRKKADKVFTAKDASEILGIDESRVRTLCREGRLGTKFGSVWIITAEQIREYRKAGPMKPGRKPQG